MKKSLKDINSDMFNVGCMILPEPSLTDGLGYPIVNPDGTITHNRVKDVFFYNDLEHAKSLDPIALRQVLSTDMSEEGFSPADLDDEDMLNDVIDSCPSRYLYSPHDIKNYLDHIKKEVKQRRDYAQHLVSKSNQKSSE